MAVNTEAKMVVCPICEHYRGWDKATGRLRHKTDMDDDNTWTKCMLCKGEGHILPLNAP